MAGILDEIEPLKQTALAELKAATDLAALDQAKGDWVGPHGKFTALMKQLGGLSKEERPAAGKLINAAKAELETALATHREELELRAALPKEPTDFTLTGRRSRMSIIVSMRSILPQITPHAIRRTRFIWQTPHPAPPPSPHPMGRGTG